MLHAYVKMTYNSIIFHLVVF